MVITDHAFYHRYHIDLRRNTRAEGSDTDRQLVHLQDGSHLGYDRLLIATGASPRRLSIDSGAVKNRMFTLGRWPMPAQFSTHRNGPTMC
jgi:NADPH-dependent 2,4-dienoyl-CoA reductase/sulfur reductase-like enzyme